MQYPPGFFTRLTSILPRSAPLPPSDTGDDRYAAIAGLDEAVGAETEGERWSDRTAIITRLDHEEYARWVKNF